MIQLRKVPDTGGISYAKDPDCRRGMLWDEAKQDKAVLEYYKKLLNLRKNEPCITEGQPCYVLTDDKNGVVVEERIIRKGKRVRKVVIIYHCGNKAVELPMYAGKYNLLSDTTFDGKVKGYETVVLLMEGGKIG